MKIDKLNGEMAFNEEQHLYFNTKYPQRQYTSVTTLIGKYHEKFDSEFWSSYKAMEALMGVDEFVQSGLKKELLNKKVWKEEYINVFGEEHNVTIDSFLDKKQEILAGYDKVRDDACERGTNYHNKQENKFYEKKEHSLLEYNFNLQHLTQQFECERNNFDLNRENAVLPEYLVYYSSTDGILNIAGQIDVLVKQGNDIYILDYKTNAKGIEMNSYFNPKTRKRQMMFFPINDIEDCAFQHYTLQLSLYAWMLQKINPNFNIKLLRICHVDGNDVETLYDLDYKADHVVKMLKDYKRQIQVDYNRTTGKFLQ